MSTSPSAVAGASSGPSSEMKLLIAIGGIYTCFITFAINTEGLYSYVSPAEGEAGGKFTATLFFLLVQCLTNTALAATALLLLPSPPPSSSPPVLDYITAGCSYITAMLCSTEALKYVSLPLQALGKSCKMVPVMLFGFLLRGRRYSGRETLAVLLITAGISVFQQKQGSKQSSDGSGDSSRDGGSDGGGSYDAEQYYGMALLFLSLVLDGVTGACQDRMREAYHPATHQMMFHMNLWATVLLSLLVTASGQLTLGLAYCTANPKAAYYIALAALSMAAGQNFVFYTLTHFDALTLATITTTRKFFTIIVSAVYYQHQFGTSQLLGVGLVFLGLVLELVNKYSAKQEKSRRKELQQGRGEKQE